MNRLAPGDTVCCRIDAGFIIYAYTENYEFIETFEIICLVDEGFLVKVPTRTILKNSFTITKAKLKEHKIPKQFIDAEAHFITVEHICSIRTRMNGAVCDKCKEFFEYAARDESGLFCCFICKNYGYRS